MAFTHSKAIWCVVVMLVWAFRVSFIFLSQPTSSLKLFLLFFCSIFVCSALGNVLGKFGVPYLTFPFNILAITSFLTFQTIYPPEAPLSTADEISPTAEVITAPLGIALINESTVPLLIEQNINQSMVNAAQEEVEGIIWNSVGMGILLSMGQVTRTFS